ncbi:folate-binding protein [Mycobacterium sp. MYCO198283]|uniref:CAF17-like 4Fe-4S cluster assembly/insertion protein YgfZ n=1 Tax=Mycobacterium sp. MYCO198283 TaxID=2883505 RepID=UPI001E3DF65A|nr:folate-binding protein [Mycobacterium sp. MYCO198283]MCG5431289.1 folate-binding protein [Mycobacterium sp. MYCO198283]
MSTSPHAVPAPDSSPDAGAVWHYGDPLGEQRAALTDAVAVDRSHRAVITLTGGERLSWLHTISSQHVSGQADGTAVQNLSLDGQGRVEDHWWQTESGGTTYLDTEPWRGAPLLGYLQRMVFWSDVTVTAAAYGVLSLLGPALHEPAVREALGVGALPAPLVAVETADGGLVRGMPVAAGGPGAAVDVLAPHDRIADLRRRLADAGVRPAGVWAYEAHRAAAVRARLGVDTDDRTIPHEVGWIGPAVHLDKGCYRGQETVARVHNLGKPPRMLVLTHLDGSAGDGRRPAPGDPVLAGGRTVGRLGTVVDHVDLGPIALALVKRGIPADTALTSGGEVVAELVIDPDTVPGDDGVGAGRLAVDRLRGVTR